MTLVSGTRTTSVFRKERKKKKEKRKENRKKSRNKKAIRSSSKHEDDQEELVDMRYLSSLYRQGSAAHVGVVLSLQVAFVEREASH